MGMGIYRDMGYTFLYGIQGNPQTVRRLIKC